MVLGMDGRAPTLRNTYYKGIYSFSETLQKSTNKCDEYEGMIVVFREGGREGVDLWVCKGAIGAREFSKV